MSRTKTTRTGTFTETALGPWLDRGPFAKLLKVLVYALLVLVFAGPLLAIFVGAFSRVVDPTQLSLIPDSVSLDNFEQAASRGVFQYLLNSAIVVGFGLALQLIVTTLAGYALARKKFRGAALVLVAILATMMLPEEVLAIPLSLVLADVPIVHVNLIGSLAGMIVPIAAWGFAILVMTEFMKEIPVELEEAARLDGASDFRIFSWIILPLSRPALGVVAIFGFTHIWDQYMLPLLVATSSDQYTLPLALRTLRTDESLGIGVVLAASLLALLPSVVMFLLLQRSFMKGLTSGAIKG